MEERKIVNLSKEEHAEYREMMNVIHTSRNAEEIRFYHQKIKEFLERKWKEQNEKMDHGQ